MGFLSSEITKPNYWYYMLDEMRNVAQQGFEGQIQSYTTYMGDLWDQWKNYRTIAQETIAGIGDSARSAYVASKARVDAREQDFLRGYKDQSKDLKKQTRETKDQTTAALGFRGLGNTTTVNQARTGIQGRADELQGEMDERRDLGVRDFENRRLDLKAKRQEWKDMWALQKAQMETQVESRRPIMMNPGPAAREAHQMNLINMGYAAQDQDIVVGEEGGWGSALLTAGGAIAGGIFGGPSGAMLGASLGGALGGGLEAGWGAPGYQQQGSQQMMSGLMSAGMIGMSPYSQWSWGTPTPGYGQGLGVAAPAYNPWYSPSPYAAPASGYGSAGFPYAGPPQ